MILHDRLTLFEQTQQDILQRLQRLEKMECSSPSAQSYAYQHSSCYQPVFQMQEPEKTILQSPHVMPGQPVGPISGPQPSITSPVQPVPGSSLQSPSALPPDPEMDTEPLVNLTSVKSSANALPSSMIKTAGLCRVEDVIARYPKLRGESKAGTLACKLAQEAIFGKEVLKQCTPAGNRELPGLPVKELVELKKIMFKQFPQYQRSPVEFEPIWRKCLDAVQQSCKRLRKSA